MEDALERDFELHGAPLVLRFDRAKAHQATRVRALCTRHGVLLLHGPPRHPQYYAQLERQNREHRAWLDRTECQDDRALLSELECMRVMLNSTWPRRSLGWRTAEEAWSSRPQITLNRRELRDEVDDLTARITLSLGELGYSGLAERFAIETALTRRGLLRRAERGDCQDISIS